MSFLKIGTKKLIIFQNPDGTYGLDKKGDWQYAEICDVMASICGDLATETAKHTGMPLALIQNAMIRIIEHRASRKEE